MIKPESVPRQLEMENSMESFENVVGGEISIVSLPEGFIMICKEFVNEEKLNRNIMDTNIFGTIVIAKKCDKSKEIIGLVEEEIVLLSEVFSNKIISEEKLKSVYDFV